MPQLFSYIYNIGPFRKFGHDTNTCLCLSCGMYRVVVEYADEMVSIFSTSLSGVTVRASTLTLGGRWFKSWLIRTRDLKKMVRAASLLDSALKKYCKGYPAKNLLPPFKNRANK